MIESDFKFEDDENVFEMGTKNVGKFVDIGINNQTSEAYGSFNELSRPSEDCSKLFKMEDIKQIKPKSFCFLIELYIMSLEITLISKFVTKYSLQAAHLPI